MMDSARETQSIIDVNFFLARLGSRRERPRDREFAAALWLWSWRFRARLARESRDMVLLAALDREYAMLTAL